MTLRNENRRGYRKTKVGWKVYKFGELANFRNGLNFIKTDKGYKYKLIGVTGFQDYFSPKEDSVEYVDVKKEINQDDFLNKDDLLFVRSNGNKALIGRCLYIDKELKQLSFSGFTIRARIKSKEVLPIYLARYFRTKKYKDQIYLFGGGTNISNLSQDILSKIKIPLPPLPEQKKIAEILSTWDLAVEQLRRLIDAKKRLKKGLMQQLLTGRMRFPGFGKPVKRKGELPEGWREIRLGEFVDADPKRILDTQRPAKYVEMAAINIETGKVDYFKSRKSSGGESAFQNGDTIFAKITPCIENGKIAYIDNLAEKEVALGSTEFIVLSPLKNKSNSKYVYHLSKSHHIHSFAISHMEGTSGRQRVPIWVFRDPKIKVPIIDEQEIISAILNYLEDMILKLGEKMMVFKKQKQGLMQKLLTGVIRVKTNKG